ncbi:MAG: radical SAM protein [Candidatus Omnitrophica bacterium]|nr:radical SAM protein [Candidatus Omnitrophota bacterium]
MTNQNNFQKFVNSQVKTLLIFPQSFEPNVEPPLGISLIAACLRQTGHEVDLLDLTVEPQKRPDWNIYSVIGISLLCANFNNGVSLAKRIRQENQGACIVAGGPFPDICTEEVLETGFFDVVVHGEGEKVFVQLVEALESGKDFSIVKGLSFYQDGKIVRTENPPQIEDLDALPFPAYDLLPMNRYNESSIIASRGCPFNCIFCNRGPAESKIVRRLSPEHVIDWVTVLINDFGCHNIRFVDSTFTLDQEWAEKICDLILKRNLRFQWTCQSRIDCINSTLLGKMRKAGCLRFYIGVETGNEKILTLLKKGFSKADVRIGAQLFKSVDAPQLNIDFIIGHPWDTVMTIRETAKFAQDLYKKFGAKCGFFLMTPFPGTELWNNAEGYGLNITKNWEKFCKMSFKGDCDRLSANFDTKYLSREELTRLYHKTQQRYGVGLHKHLDALNFLMAGKDFKQAKQIARKLISEGYLTFKVLIIAILPHTILKFLYTIYQRSNM